MQFLKTIKNRIRAIVGGLILSSVIRLLKLTLRIEVEGKEYVEDAKRQGKGIIYVFWHGQMLLPMMVHTGLGVPVMVSEHTDGELIAQVLRFLGYSLVRGSSTRGGRKALIDMTYLLRENREVAITPDGPSGPNRECKMGTVILAAHTGTPIIPIAASASRFFLLKSWDRFQLVFPWSRCIVQYGAPIVFARPTQPEQIKKAAHIIENTLETVGKELLTHCKVNPLGYSTINDAEKDKNNTLVEKGFNILSTGYKSVVAIRSLAYNEGIFKQKSLPVPVISIGNLTLGGTGKTPMTIMLARFLQKNGKRVGILTRGYGRRTKGTRIASDGTIKIDDWRQIGDEPALMAQQLPGIPIVVDEKKYRAGVIACRNFRCNIILLDDGYQHRGLQRDLDIVLLNAALPFGNGKLFPAGLLREPPPALKRADVIVLTKGSEISKTTEREIRQYSEAPIFRANYVYRHLLKWDGTEYISLEQCQNLRAVAFAGLGNPDPFFRQLRDMGISVRGEEYFYDHYPYKERDWKNLGALMIRKRADILITTQKDIFRFDKSTIKDYPLFYVDVDWEIPEKQDKFFEIILNSMPS